VPSAWVSSSASSRATESLRKLRLRNGAPAKPLALCAPDETRHKPDCPEMSTDKGEPHLDRDAAGESDLPKNWKEALAALVLSRVEMIRIEAKAASAGAVGRITLLIVGLFGFLSAWVLALAASIGAIAAATSWEWYHVAFASAGAHFLIGAILLFILKSWKKETFPVTRAEFEKDREWLNRLKNQ